MLPGQFLARPPDLANRLCLFNGGDQQADRYVLGSPLDLEETTHRRRLERVNPEPVDRVGGNPNNQPGVNGLGGLADHGLTATTYRSRPAMSCRTTAGRSLKQLLADTP